MEENRAEWLPHLTSEIVSNIHGNLLDAYVVALEGWRRGLTLRWHVKDSEKFKDMRTWYVDKPGQLFSLSSKDRTHYFFRTRGDKVTNEAVDIGRDKQRTKQALKNKRIAIPEGKQFTKDITNEEIIQYAIQLGFPVVLKPTNGSFGKGVIPNITKSEELEHTLEYVRTTLNYPDVIIEQYIPGKEYRLYVVDQQVIGAMNRVPANVTGDGINSIQALIEIKNRERSLNPRLISCPIIINSEVESFIARSGYTFDTVPKKGEVIFLNEKTNISIGGDPIDVFDEISSHVKEAAVKALHAVPGLEHGAVDLIVHCDTSEVYIIELNPTANLGGLLYPIEGKSRDIPKAIIDYYFPETKQDINSAVNVYFDYQDALLPLSDKTAVITTISPFKYNNLFGKKYTLAGIVQSLGFHQWLKSKAIEQSLIGYINKLEDDSIEVVVAGTNKSIVDGFKDVCLQETPRSSVLKISEQEFNEPIKIGFEIQGQKMNLLNELKEIQIEIVESKQDLEILEKKHYNMLNSRIWKYTLPVRKITGAIKSIYGLIFKR